MLTKPHTYCATHLGEGGSMSKWSQIQEQYDGIGKKWTTLRNFRTEKKRKKRTVAD